MSRLTQTFPARRVTPPDTVNHAGGGAYLPTTPEALAELLMLGTFGNTFYASGQDWAQETATLCKSMVKEDPQFVAQAAVMARTSGYVRSAPLVALMTLLSDGPRAQQYGRHIFDRIVRTGDDLRNLVGLALSKQFRNGYGGTVRRQVARWLNTQLDEYQAIKYAGSSDRLSLRNILRMTHPTPADATHEAIFRWLVKGTRTPDVPLPQITALEALAHGDLDPVTAIDESRLPFEAVMPRVAQGDAAVWTALLHHAPYMFLLRSLGAMGRAGVWDDPANLAHAVSILTDPTRVAKSMQFPFRYYTAAQTIQGQVPQTLVNAVYDALEVSLSNLPDLGSLRVALAPDVSGSMGYAAVNDKTSAAAIAGIFTGALWKRVPHATVLPFERDVRLMPGSPRDSVITLAHQLQQMSGGGTDLAAPIRALHERREVVDLFVGLTDSEDWSASGGWYGHGGFPEAWKAYRKMAPNAQAVLIQLVPSGTRVAPPSDSSVHYVYGWSDQVLRYLQYVVQGQSMTDRIRQVAL